MGLGIRLPMRQKRVEGLPLAQLKDRKLAFVVCLLSCVFRAKKEICTIKEDRKRHQKKIKSESTMLKIEIKFKGKTILYIKAH